MAIIVTCPNCGTRLSAPDSAVGKFIKCPKPGCGTLTEVQAFLPVEEVPVVDAVPVVTRPRQASTEGDGDDDRPRPRPRLRRRDDDDFDRTPRRRRRPGANPAAVAAFVLGGLVLVAGIGIGNYLLVNTRRGDTAGSDNGGGGTRPKAPVPPGWVRHTSPGKFKAYYPKSPLATTTNVSSLPDQPLDMVMTGGPRERLAVIVFVMPLPPQAAGLDRDRIAEQIRLGILMKQGKGRVLAQRSLTWSGRKALEMTLESSNKKATVVYRQLIADKCMYLAFFACETGPSPDEENGFFDNFEILE